MAATLQEALAHPAVALVLGIHGDDQAVNAAVTELVAGSNGIKLVPQRRLGNLRPGKGDAINTGFRIFLEETDYQRLHFYDADIRSFDRGWIQRAEFALDKGFQAVRHFYPRSPTDGMITWMVTRPGFGLLWSDSVLPWIEQPMSGEVAFARDAVALLMGDPIVAAQSDWGIDTAITHRSVALGLSIYETFAPQGKDHQLYGSLEELRTMLLECLHTLQRLRGASPPRAVEHFAESAASEEAPAAVQRVAYDVNATRAIAYQSWSPEQQELLRHYFDQDLNDLDTPTWLAVLDVLLRDFDPSSRDWHEVAFRLWTRRVLFYSEGIEGLPYTEAMIHLQAMVRMAISW